MTILIITYVLVFEFTFKEKIIIMQELKLLFSES